ncbi:MAG: alpha/beta hydrolase [Alistipes sp.]|nr:alpha/beta hydrolase [Alistipes sp.]
MKSYLYIAALTIMLLGSCTNKQQQKADAGQLDIYENFATELIPQRTVLVWLPEDYNPQNRYAVLYMHDGQMLFDEQTSWNKQSWNVDAVAQRLQDEGRCRPFIVVGIDNHPTNRLTEYTPARMLSYLDQENALLNSFQREEFIADNYLRFIVEELKPFIDSRYSTLSDRDNTLIMGSSMGGLISLYALCEYPDYFGAAACLSTHTPAAIGDFEHEAEPWSKAFRDYLKDNLPAANSRVVYMDYGDGTIDAGYGPYQALVDSLFAEKGWTEPHFISRFFPGHQHDETSWQQRLHIPLELLLGAE